MNTNMSIVKVLEEKDISREIISLQSTLNFSQTRVGPGCNGCYTIVFDTICGHQFLYRKRCELRAPVCAGSEILLVYPQNIILRLDSCSPCASIKKDNGRIKLKGIRKHAPKKTVAKMRLNEGRERWLRQLIEAGLAEKKRLSSQGGADLQASHNGKAPEVEIVDLTAE